MIASPVCWMVLQSAITWNTFVAIAAISQWLAEDFWSSRKPIRDRVRSVLKLAEFLCVGLEEYMMLMCQTSWSMTPDSDTHDPSKYELLHILATAQCMDCCQCRCHVKAGSFDLLFFFVTTGRQDSLGGSAKTLMFVNCSPASSNCEEWMIGGCPEESCNINGFISKT